jgi:Icc protein
VTASSLFIAQISDLHIKRPGERAYGVVDTAEALERCIAHLNDMQPKPTLVVCSGDLVDSGLDEEYEHLKRLLAPLAYPLVVIPGNHDAREPLRRAFPDQPYAASAGAMNCLVKLDALDIVLLDSSVPGMAHGFLDTQTLTWLETVLAAPPERPALVFLHHPPFETGIAYMDCLNLRNSTEFSHILGRHPRVRLTAAGHVHRAVLSEFAGRPATICPAPCDAVVLDIAGTLPPSFRLEPPALHLHAWFAGPKYGNLVTHFVPIGQFEGPYPFFAEDGRIL